MTRKNSTTEEVTTEDATTMAPQTPLSEELEEVQWPHCLNSAVLPQFDGESDLKEFLLKYEATIEAAGGGSACKAKVLILALQGLAQ
jgi:hypothetical protein